MTPKKIFAFLILGIFFLAQTDSLEAGADVYRVIHLSGKAQVLDATSGQWKFLAIGDRLKSRDRVRTVGKSAVDFSRGEDLTGLLRVGVETEVEVMGEDLSRFFVRRGLLFVLLEDENNLETQESQTALHFQVFTPDLTVSFLQGGCSIAVSEKGTLVRVFSEKVSVETLGSKNKKRAARMVLEGHQFFWNKAASLTYSSSRMVFAEYMDWKYWMLQCYAFKDKRVQDTLVKK